jgi:hypothetical protein
MILALFLGMPGQAGAQPTYSFTTLDVPGAFFPRGTIAHGINASGQIVGYYNGFSTDHSFLLDHGNFTLLDVPVSFGIEASGINDSGQMV